MFPSRRWRQLLLHDAAVCPGAQEPNQCPIKCSFQQVQQQLLGVKTAHVSEEQRFQSPRVTPLHHFFRKHDRKALNLLNCRDILHENMKRRQLMHFKLQQPTLRRTAGCRRPTQSSFGAGRALIGR